MFQAKRCEFLSPAKINAGKKALAHIPGELAALGAERPLLVTTKGIGKKSPLKAVISALRDSSVWLGVFDGVDESADMKTVLRLADLFRDGGFDAIIALGSGPVVHTAKIVNLAVTENTEDLDPFVFEGPQTIKRQKPLMVIPATAGDGWEYTPVAFVDDRVFSSPFMMPRIVVSDSAAVLEEDALKVISAGMNALIQAVEGFVSPWKNPFADAYAHTAIEMIFNHLLPALSGRGWRSSREVLDCAAVMGGCVFSNMPKGLTFLLASELAREADCAFGLCMGILLPYVLDSLSARDDFFVDDLLLPLAGAEVFALTSSGLRSNQAVAMLQEFQFSLYETTDRRLPLSLQDAGIEKEHFKTVASEVIKQASFEVNGELCLMILEHAFRGDAMDLN